MATTILPVTANKMDYDTLQRCKCQKISTMVCPLESVKRIIAISKLHILRLLVLFLVLLLWSMGKIHRDCLENIIFMTGLLKGIESPMVRK